MFRWKERGIAALIPYVGHARDDVLLHDDGSLTAILAIGGIAWQTTDAAVIIARHGDYHNALRNINDDVLTISTYQCRGMADPSLYPGRRLPSKFAGEFDDLYREYLFTGRLFDNRLYITVTIRPASYVSKFITSQMRKRRKPATSANPDRLERLDTVCTLLQAKLRAYLPTRMGIRRTGNVWFSAMAEALVFAMTGIWRPIGLTTGPLKNAMFSERIIIGREAIEIRTPGWSAYAAIFGIKEYPAATWPGMFAALSTSAYRCTLFQAFTFIGKAQAEGIINRKQNFMIGAEDKAFEQLDELKQAGNDLMANKMILGEHTISLIVFADSIKDLKFVTTETWRDLADSGAVVARESAALEAALFSFLPGNDRLWPRPGFITSRNFAAMAPLHNFPAGPEQEHWGEPIAIFRTTAATPYRFHWHVDGVANVLVTGETGSGKSFLVGFLMAMTAGRARIFALDYKRGWELLFRTMSADYAVIGDGEPHLSPLKVLDPTPKNLIFLNDLIRGCIGQKMTAEEDRRLPLALKIVMAQPPEYRSLGEIAAFLGTDPNGAGTALQRWCWGNELGWVIDAPEDHMDFNGDMIGRDLTALLENPRARAPALLTIFYYIELQLDGRPILIPNDEGWRSLLDEHFRPMIERRLRTIRSFGGAFVFLTQGPDEIKKSDIGAVLIQQCPTQICLPVDRASEEDYRNVLKLSDGEWEAFSELRKGDRRFLIRQGDRSVVAELVLPNVDDHIATLSANQETLNALDEVRRITGHGNKEPIDEHLPEVHRVRRAVVEQRKNSQKQKGTGMTRTIITAAVLASVMGGRAYAQIPVTDSGSIAQEVISVGQQAKQYALQGEQYVKQAQQLAQQVQQYYAFVQNPSLGAAGTIINQAGVGNDLPINPSALAGLTSGYSMSLSGLAGKLQTLSNLANTSYNQNHVYDCTDQSWACQQQRQRAYGLAGTAGVAQSAYQDLRNHMPVVQALQQRAATATTPAEREEVANALAAESAWNQNMVAQVQAAQMQANADKESLVQRDNEQLSKNINDTLTSIPSN